MSSRNRPSRSATSRPVPAFGALAEHVLQRSVAAAVAGEHQPAALGPACPCRPRRRARRGSARPSPGRPVGSNDLPPLPKLEWNLPLGQDGDQWPPAAAGRRGDLLLDVLGAQVARRIARLAHARRVAVQVHEHVELGLLAQRDAVGDITIALPARRGLRRSPRRPGGATASCPVPRRSSSGRPSPGSPRHWLPSGMPWIGIRRAPCRRLGNGHLARVGRLGAHAPPFQPPARASRARATSALPAVRWRARRSSCASSGAGAGAGVLGSRVPSRFPHEPHGATLPGSVRRVGVCSRRSHGRQTARRRAGPPLAPARAGGTGRRAPAASRAARGDPASPAGRRERRDARAVAPACAAQAQDRRGDLGGGLERPRLRGPQKHFAGPDRPTGTPRQRYGVLARSTRRTGSRGRSKWCARQHRRGTFFGHGTPMHKDLHALKTAETELKKTGVPDAPFSKLWAYNPRTQTGGQWSNHADGKAIDFDEVTNPRLLAGRSRGDQRADRDGHRRRQPGRGEGMDTYDASKEASERFQDRYSDEGLGERARSSATRRTTSRGSARSSPRCSAAIPTGKKKGEAKPTADQKALARSSRRAGGQAGRDRRRGSPRARRSRRSASVQALDKAVDGPREGDRQLEGEIDRSRPR